MAKTILPLMSGQASGKFGDIVFMRRGGQNIARIRVIPANPRSILQQASRLNMSSLSKIFAGGGSLASLFRGAGNARFLVTADEGGAIGNQDSITLVDPVGNNAALDVSVVGKAITVSLATDGASAPTSTAAQVRDAINNDPEASVLVTASLPADSNGTGVVAAAAVTSLAGGVDAGPFEVRRTNKLTTPVVVTSSNEAILTPAEAASWLSAQEFIGFNAKNLAANVVLSRTKP